MFQNGTPDKPNKCWKLKSFLIYVFLIWVHIFLLIIFNQLFRSFVSVYNKNVQMALTLGDFSKMFSGFFLKL